MAHDSSLVPPFVTALYSESVQDVIRQKERHLHVLWAQALEAARREGYGHYARGRITLFA